ncbi:MAG: hypothetical protein AAGA96_05385 [Verrucomicrobiota bacterium]
MDAIGPILTGIGGIAWLVLWIITLIKQFKGGDTVWGILTIFFSPLVPIIWGFVKNQKKFALYWIIVAVIFFIGYGSVGMTLMSQMEQM